MNVYNIGRDETWSDIVIDDQSNYTSNHHAVLKATKGDKFTIVDCSTNGTYVNGVRIEPNVEVPVTRKDTVSFAHVATLDWNIVPRQSKTGAIILWICLGLFALSLVGGGIAAYMLTDIFKGEDGREVKDVESVADTTAVSDTMVVKTADTTPEEIAPKEPIKSAKKTSLKTSETETAKQATDKVEPMPQTAEENSAPQADDENPIITNPIL